MQTSSLMPNAPSAQPGPLPLGPMGPAASPANETGRAQPAFCPARAFTCPGLETAGTGYANRPSAQAVP